MYWTRLIADFTDIFLFFCQNQQKNQGKSERVLTKNDPTNCFYFDKKFAPKILLDFLIFCFVELSRHHLSLRANKHYLFDFIIFYYYCYY